ncbi:MAG: 16S rRNA (uracil(1498)-N(3))-methyltransferase [Acidobacteria bacterium]|nr:MAG: 16S rRNA (uracil(1498)-N(3))-methyltransferase [Acidobacteriota bacterium]
MGRIPPGAGREVITLLVSPDALDASPIEVTGDSYRHLFRARRLELGERVRVVDGKGHARWSTVEQVGRTTARLVVAEETPGNEPERELTILAAAPRMQRAAWLVEKTTEIGAVTIRFINSERSPRSYGEASLGRLRRVAAAAVEQCHRARIPEITGVHPFSELANLLAGCPQRWFLDPYGAAGMDPGTGPVALLVGPEGGWSEIEREALLGLDCRRWGLGERTLRVETAAVAGCSLILLAKTPM